MSRERPPRVKFCGITRVEDAEHAVSLGAWAIGLNLWAGSVRCILPQEAADIADAVRRRIEIAGVFVNEELDALVTLAEEIGLTMVQLHGDEGSAYAQAVARRTGAKVIKAARIRDAGDVKAIAAFPNADFHLLDAYVPGSRGGTGASFSWELARRHGSGPKRAPVILSGGLTPENVAEAAGIARPYAVDVASGIESAPGVKDHARMDAFMAALVPTDAADDDIQSAGAESAGVQTATGAESAGVQTATGVESAGVQTATGAETAAGAGDPAEPQPEPGSVS